MRVSLCGDIGQLLTPEAFSVYSACMYKPSYEKYYERIRSLFEGEDNAVYLLEDGGIKGMLVLGMGGDVPEIVGIAVDEGCRGRGLGRYMIEEVIAAEGICVLFAQTDDDAVGFYRKCGFSVEKETVEYPDGTAERYNCWYQRAL